MSLRSELEKYSVSIFVGMTLFLAFSIFSLITNASLIEKERINKEVIRSLRVQTSQLTAVLNVKESFVGKKMPTFGLMPLSSDGFAPGRFSIVLFIIGKCPSCFEDEIPLWNRLAEDARKKGISYLAINCSLHRELILEYQRERMVEFAIIDGGEEFKDFFGGFETHQLLCFVVDSNLTILKAHSSIPKQPELTEEFCRNVLAFIEKG